MVKGDDVKAKKKNKKIRKKLNRDPSTAVSSRIAAIIAAKKRRHTGKRRQCQGMCFSLPTPEDPFNDRRGREDTTVKKGKKPLRPLSYNKESCQDGSQKMGLANQGHDKNTATREGNNKVGLKDESSRHLSSPSKFLFSCLNSIRDFFAVDGIDQDRSFIGNSWGFEFWKYYHLGRDILENSGTSPSKQQIAWIASTAADSLQQKEREHVTIDSPFLLYLVPSQEKAVEVRSVFKPLKILGVHTVSLHAGSSLEHQIYGLKRCDPEFIIATPDRLWELVTRKEIDISAVALLVVDVVDSLDLVKYIRDSISGNPHTVIFRDCSSDVSSQAVELQGIVREPVDISSLA